ncbi:uncharacterized protein LOC108914235 [Anoplophora glabripennis]|uniref:uncharacterized protein LOC108914235 n=1 Tax=Anoplophora glabripennis TaxID=217634 RepID=UPI000874B9D0|nr:uncharacterized protein LOC108914235 [Anoplophora glabripennis]
MSEIEETFIRPFGVIKIALLSYLIYIIYFDSDEYCDYDLSLTWYFFVFIIAQFDIGEYKGPDTANERPSEQQDFNFLTEPVPSIYPNSKENHLNGGGDHDNNVATWKVTLACLLTLGIVMKMLFLLRRSTETVVRIILILVISFLATVVATLWFWYIQASPQLSKGFLTLLVLFTTVILIVCVTIIYLVLKSRPSFFGLYSVRFIGDVIMKYISPATVILKQSAEAIFSMPHLFVVSVSTFFVKLVILIIFFATTMYVGSGGTLLETNERYGIYTTAYFSTILDACLAIWAVQFVTGIQNMMLRRAMGRWYFSMIKHFQSHSIFAVIDAFTFNSSTIGLESMMLTIAATITSLLATYKRNYLVRYFATYEKFINFLYDKFYYFSGTGFVTLFNVRSVATSMVWNILLGVITSFFVIVGALSCWYSQVLVNQDLWVLITFFSILLLILFSALIFLQKKFTMVIVVLKESLRAALHVPRTVIFSTLLFFVELFILIAFATKTMNMGSSGMLPETVQEYIMFYKHRAMLFFSLVLNACLAIWAIKFVTGVEAMIFSTAVAKHYFSRSNNRWDNDIQTKFPSSISQINLGAIAFNSLLQFFGSNKNIPGSSIIKRSLMYLFNNGYILTGSITNHWAPHKEDARERQNIFPEMMSVATFNYIGHNIILMIQLLVVLLSLLSTYLVMLVTNSPYQWEIYATVGFISTVMAVTCFSVFQNVIDSILLCSCDDWLINDVMARPFSMSDSLTWNIANS